MNDIDVWLQFCRAEELRRDQHKADETAEHCVCARLLHYEDTHNKPKE